MTSFITIACLLIALFFLGLLFIIDLKTRLLPNKYVAGFLFAGFVLHVTTRFSFVPFTDALLGMVAGAGLLFAVRLVANGVYQRDTLGLGDVKLMGAAGLWLGIDSIFLAISLGAFAGLLHGVGYKYYTQKKTGEKVSLSTLSIPAGPGFIVGIVAASVPVFWTLPKFVLDFP